MISYQFRQGESLSLDRWELEHEPRFGPATPKAEVSVPHSAMTDLVDVRSGGVARYRIAIEVPAVIGDEALEFEGVGLDPVVTINGERAAGRVGLWGPWHVPVGHLLRPGVNEISAEVSLPDFEPSSPMFYRHLLLGIVPDVEGPFAGIWQPVRLRNAPHDPSSLTFEIDHDARTVDVVCDDPEASIGVHVEDAAGNRFAATAVGAGRWRVRPTGARAWSCSDPARYRLVVRRGEQEALDLWFGFREVRVEADRMRVGGEPFAMRGALLWGFYNTRTPWASEAALRAELEQIRDLGFNCVKVCLFIAPAVFYDLCDELGLAVWQELPLWLPQPGTQVLDRAAAEYPRLLEWLRHHPSIVMLSLGCELGAHVPTSFLDEQYAIAHALFPHTIVCANSGSGECYGGGYSAQSDIYDYHFYGDVHNVELLTQYFTGLPRQPRPWLFGEYNDADTWRWQGDEGAPYWRSTDPAVNPLLSIHAGYDSDQPVYRQREIVEAEGYLDELEGLEEISATQSLEVRKLQLEMVRRRPEVSGYALSELRDTPNTAVGVTDQVGRLKYSFDDFYAVNSARVLTIEAPLRRRWTFGGDRLLTTDSRNVVSGGELPLAIRLSNQSGLEGPGRLVVRLADLPAVEVEVELHPHSTATLAEVSVRAPQAAEATSVHELDVSLWDVAGTPVAWNHWDVLVHPVAPTAPVAWLDPEGLLGAPDEVAAWLGGPRLRNSAELLDSTSPLILTTQCSPTTLRELAKRAARVFVLGSHDLFPITTGSFSRENVKRVWDGWVNAAMPQAGLGSAHVALAADRFVSRRDIESVVGRFESHVTRYDTRKFGVGEYLFSWQEGAATLTYSTLNHAGGSAPQPSHPEENLLGRRIVDAWRSQIAPHSSAAHTEEGKHS